MGLLSTAIKVIVRENEWLSEVALWAAWNHRGKLTAAFSCHYVTLDGLEVANLTLKYDSTFYTYLRYFGILLVGQVEHLDKTQPNTVTDQSLEAGILESIHLRVKLFQHNRVENQRSFAARLNAC